MSTIDATVTIMQNLPENDRRKVFAYAQMLKSSENIDNPFIPLNLEAVLADLSKSEEEFSEGRGLNAEEAINSLRKQHGFI